MLVWPSHTQCNGGCLTEPLIIESEAAADRPADLPVLLQRIARTPIERFDLQHVLVELLKLAATGAGARSAYLKRVNGEPGRPAIMACTDEGLIALDGTVSSHVVPIISLGVQVAVLVLLHEGAPGTLSNEQESFVEVVADGISVAMRRANADDEIRRNQIALREAVEAKYQLVGGVSVSLKNTLTVVAGYMQLLELRDTLTPFQEDYIGRGKTAINSAVGLINELVELSRAEAGDLPLELTSVNLVALVRDAIANHGQTAAMKRLLVNVDTPARTPPVYTDPSHVREILDALLQNAVKYTPDGGCVTVRLEQRPGRRMSDPISWVCISVQDTGPGIAEPESLFEEARRIETRGSPMGFRLVICRRVARLLGGDLTLDNSAGRGAKFTLWLPLTAATV